MDKTLLEKVVNLETLTDKEVELIQSYRKQNELKRKRERFDEVCRQIVSQWLEWSVKEGAGLTYSTFTSDYEFNVNGRLDLLNADEFIDYRKTIYHGVDKVLECLRLLNLVQEIK